VGLVAAATICLLVASAPALGSTPAVTIDTRTPTLEEADEGASKFGLTFLNLTGAAAEIEAKAGGQRACVLTPDKTRLVSAESTPVSIAVPATCKADDGLTVDVVVTSGSTRLASFEVTPEVKPADESEWGNLYAFPLAWVATLVVLALLLSKGWTPPEGATRSPFQRLHLDATWKFNDNWATNISAVGALVTGLFGATTAKAFLGSDSESAVALATVGAAIALALLAAAPIIALATKSFKVVPVTEGGKEVVVDGKPVTKRLDSFTAGGLLLAASVVFASAVGQLWVVTATGRALELGDLEKAYLWVTFGLATLLLATYGWRSLKDLLERNTAEPPTADGDSIKAAKLVAAAIQGTKVATAGGPLATGDGEAVEIEIPALMTSPGDSYEQRPRSVLP
jgi:hypothetical protein